MNNEKVLLWLAKRFIAFFSTSNKVLIERMKEILIDEYKTLWDNQPTLEENEELALTIQHMRDLIEILVDDDDRLYE